VIAQAMPVNRAARKRCRNAASLPAPGQARRLKRSSASVTSRSIMLTPLKPHHGPHGGLLALTVLVGGIAVVWTSHPGRPGSHRDRRTPQSASQRRAATEGRAVAASVPDRTPPASIVPDPDRKTVAVDPRALRTAVTASGVVAFDETRTSRISAPVAGWLRKTRASSVGRRIQPGESLGVLYSAEVLVATADLADQVRAFRSQELLDTERWRLARWGMPASNLARIEKTLAPEAALPLVARIPGIVVAEQGGARQFVDSSSGRDLFTITDPSYVWVYVDLADADAARVRVGTPAKLRIEGVARPVTANLAYMFRRSNEGMRTVRFDLHSPSVAIVPNAAVTAELALDAERGPARP
jgi:hypothetical protein